jgi:hypothetical protein
LSSESEPDGDGLGFGNELPLPLSLPLPPCSLVICVEAHAEQVWDKRLVPPPSLKLVGQPLARPAFVTAQLVQFATDIILPDDALAGSRVLIDPGDDQARGDAFIEFNDLEVVHKPVNNKQRSQAIADANRFVLLFTIVCLHTRTPLASVQQQTVILLRNSYHTLSKDEKTYLCAHNPMKPLCEPRTPPAAPPHGPFQTPSPRRLELPSRFNSSSSSESTQSSSDSCTVSRLRR